MKGATLICLMPAGCCREKTGAFSQHCGFHQVQGQTDHKVSRCHQGEKGSGGSHNEITGALVAPASIMVILLLQLMKATVLAGSSCFLSVLWTSCNLQTQVRQVSLLSPLFNLFFCHLTLPGFLFYINMTVYTSYI